LDNVCEVIADYVDIKSSATWGHSRAVADTAAGIGNHLGLAAETVVRLRRAALVHDLGKVTVPCNALEKQEKLSTDEWERLRLHPYYTEPILLRVEGFQDLALEAGAHQERVMVAVTISS
jgi:HD-GYP domain-containing protein (c-di-GMP phosphodiesterase class II)